MQQIFTRGVRVAFIRELFCFPVETQLAASPSAGLAVHGASPVSRDKFGRWGKSDPATTNYATDYSP
jgi:hypothetical protein